MQRLRSDIKLAFRLATNDFQTKYAGNYLGVFWAFVNPIITIFIYVFIFQVAFKAAPTDTGYPYVLWLIAGIIPWFFFGEGLLSGTNAFYEYSYLVKKVVFEVRVLPVVKVFSAFFIHIFFIAFALLVFAALGRFPDYKLIQLPYYTACLLVLVVVIAFFTSSVLPFFKDTYQIVNVITQIGFWLTPIMWNFDDTCKIVNNKWMVLFNLNPVFYIVQGYRDSFMSGEWFWQRGTTLYFWAFILVAGFFATKMYKKMRPHFADVL